MCIIAIKPQGKKMFSKQQIATMFANNPDGSGYMYYDYTTKKVVVKKGFMTLNQLCESLSKKDLTNTNVILHFRIGTSGNFDELNCHPFPVYEKNATSFKTDLAVAHNGILHDYTPTKKSPINDTQIFIGQVLKHLKKGFIYDADKMALIGELIGSNKLAFLDSKNNIKLIGDFIEDNGYIYSNTSYKPKTYSYARSTSAYNNKSTTAVTSSDAHKSASTGCTTVKDNRSYANDVDIFGESNEETNEFWDWFDEEMLGY